jgi:glycosyltransferase involved in cell wall biosynthesis
VAIKVLVVGTHLDRVEANIFAGLAARGFSLSIMAEPTTPHVDVLNAAGIEYTPLSCRGRIDLKAVQLIRRKLRSGRYSIIHGLSNRGISNGLLAALGTSVKRVAYRGTVGHISFFDPLSWLTYLNPTLDKIVCVSDAVRLYLAQKVSPTKLITIRKGHRLEWYPRAAQRALHEFAIPEDAFVISCVANMRPVKGVPYLLDAVDALPSSSKAHLLLIGHIDSQSQRAITANRRHPERIHAIGFHAAPHTLVSQSDCFVMPSIDREGLPKALLEAMAVGVPAIGTNVGGIPEVIAHNESGLIVPPKDARAIADAITLLESSPEQRWRFARMAQDSVCSQLSVDRSIEQTAEMYRCLCGGITDANTDHC